MVEGLITRPSPTIEKKTKQNDNISEGKQKYLMGDFFFYSDLHFTQKGHK